MADFKLLIAVHLGIGSRVSEKNRREHVKIKTQKTEPPPTF